MRSLAGYSMDGHSTRRRVLALCGSGLLASIAGCVSDDASGSDGTDSENGASGTGSENGASGPPSEGEFFEELRLEANYGFTFSDDFGHGEGRTSDGDMFVSYEDKGFTAEMYRIGETVYQVEGEKCQKISIDTPGMDFEDPGTYFGEIDEYSEEPSVENIGTETIDGESVTVYEITYPDRPDHPERMYILDSGHLRRVEADSETTDFFDWGSTDPIEPPEMECTDMEFPGGEDSDFEY